jgi:hypothetical protein
MFAQAELNPAAGPRRRGLWLAVAATAALLVVGTVAVPLFGWVAEQNSTTTWTTTHQVAAVQIDIGSGSVSVSPGPAGVVALRQVLNWNTVRPRVTKVWEGNTLVVTETCSSHSLFAIDDCGAQLELTVPASATVQATGHSGDVTVSGMTGDVRAETESGDIELIGDTGYVWARAESGEVTGDTLRSQRMDVSTVSGDLYLVFATAPTSVTASAISGTATMVVPQGSTYRVSGQTESGARDIENGLADIASNRSIALNTVSGDAALGYPDHYGN